MQKLIPVTEAEAIIQSKLHAFSKTEEVPLPKAQGRFLRSDIRADRPLPSFDRVMMDGIAIRHAAWALGKRDFPITGIQAAGAEPVTLSDKSSCIEVMTGGVLPAESDCVIPVEDIEINGKTARIKEGYTPRPGQHIHRTGSDTAVGEILIPSGQCLHSPELTIAASCGVTSPTVASLPSIAIISTGDELVAPEETPLTHQIRRSHATALRTSITARKLGNVTEYHVPDDPNQLKETLQQALDAHDVLILTGGVSRGKYDFVAPVLKELLGAPQFHGIAQRPGKPFAFWSTEVPTNSGEKCKPYTADDGSAEGGEECKPYIKRHIFALPGNPVSVMACAARYLFPALTYLLKGDHTEPETLPANGIFNCPPHFTGLIPCKLRHGTLELVPPSNSGNFLDLAGTHGIAEVPGSLTRQQLKNQPATFYPW